MVKSTTKRNDIHRSESTPGATHCSRWQFVLAMHEFVDLFFTVAFYYRIDSLRVLCIRLHIAKPNRDSRCSSLHPHGFSSEDDRRRSCISFQKIIYCATRTIKYNKNCWQHSSCLSPFNPTMAGSRRALWINNIVFIHGATNSIFTLRSDGTRQSFNLILSFRFHPAPTARLIESFELCMDAIFGAHFVRI